MNASRLPSPFSSRNGAFWQFRRQTADSLVRRTRVRLRGNPCLPRTCTKTARFCIENCTVPTRVSGWEQAMNLSPLRGSPKPVFSGGPWRPSHECDAGVLTALSTPHTSKNPPILEVSRYTSPSLTITGNDRRCEPSQGPLTQSPSIGRYLAPWELHTR